MIYRFTDNFIYNLNTWLGTNNVLAEEAAGYMEYELTYNMRYRPEPINVEDIYKKFNVPSLEKANEIYYNQYLKQMPYGMAPIPYNIEEFWNTGVHPLSTFSSFSIELNSVKNFRKIYSPEEGQSLITKHPTKSLLGNVLFNVCELYDNPAFVHSCQEYNRNHNRILPNIDKYIFDKNKRQYEIIAKLPQVYTNDIISMGYSDNLLSQDVLHSNFELVKTKLDIQSGWIN